MTTSTLIECVVGCLETVATDAGAQYSRRDRSLNIASVPFEFAAVLLANPPAADLILVINTAAEPIERVRRRVEAFARALDTMQSRRPVTAVLVGPRPSVDDVDALLRCCRVLVVEPGNPDNWSEDIHRCLAVLLPFNHKGPLAKLADPDGELQRRVEKLPDQEHLAPLIEASRRSSGGSAVEAQLRDVLAKSLAAAINNTANESEV